MTVWFKITFFGKGIDIIEVSRTDDNVMECWNYCFAIIRAKMKTEYLYKNIEAVEMLHPDLTVC